MNGTLIIVTPGICDGKRVFRFMILDYWPIILSDGNINTTIFLLREN